MALLELKNISKNFGMLRALDQISLNVEQGDVLGIVGPNGSGKTTLINVISGYYQATQGTIRLDGKDICGLRPDRIAARGIARTFQSNVIYDSATVIESMLVSAYLQYKTSNWQAFFGTRAYRDEHERIVGRVLDILRLLDLFNDTFIPGEKLSYGYQRMLGIAIALSADPKILMLDEPTTGMNHQEAMFVVENIKKIREQGVTIIIIEHNMRVVANLATNVVVLNFGTKIAEGEPHMVMNNREVIEAYLGTETFSSN
ncbi:MAG: ABC transporter ATP-binding protein [Syntrophobacteraceae bacterium]